MQFDYDRNEFHIGREDLPYLNLLNNGFYSHICLSNRGDVSLVGYIGPVVVEYFPADDQIRFQVNGDYCTISNNRHWNVYDAASLSTLLNQALTGGKWE